MNGPDKPTEKLERLIDLGEKIIADLKALTTWEPAKEVPAVYEHPEEGVERDASHEQERRRPRSGEP